MHAFQEFILKDQSLCLTADRSIYWEQEKSLIVSDLHFGKTGHFRKAGIAVPQSLYKEDMQRLVAQIQYFKPTTMIVVGDMFHSHANKELDLFTKWRDDFPSLQILLVKGNHDILNRKWYSSAGIDIHEPTLKIGAFCFQHDPGDCRTDEKGTYEKHYVFSGHIHPGITINGIGKQSLHFPCFYFTDTYCILPAFSRFTGSVTIRPKEDEIAFAIVNHSVIRISS
jgi:DNA ligase-associated metallophosphoesterase